MNLKVGRVSPLRAVCALPNCGAHRVTRPTGSKSRGHGADRRDRGNARDFVAEEVEGTAAAFFRRRRILSATHALRRAEKVV